MGFWSWLFGKRAPRGRRAAPESPYRRPAPVPRAPDPPSRVPAPKQAAPRSRGPAGMVAVTVAASVMIAAGRSPRPSRVRQPWEYKPVDAMRPITLAPHALDFPVLSSADQASIRALEASPLTTVRGLASPPAARRPAPAPRGSTSPSGSSSAVHSPIR